MNKEGNGHPKNPRFARALAHAAIFEARRDPTLSSLERAQSAIEEAGTSRKSLESGFDRAGEKLLYQYRGRPISVTPRGRTALGFLE